MDTEATPPDSQQAIAKPRSRKKLWLFLCIAFIFIIGMGITLTILWKIEKNKDERCKANFNQLCQALMQYAMDNSDHFPNGDGLEGLSKLQGEYMKNYSSCFCPSAKIKTVHGKLTDNNISYIYFGGFSDCSGDHWPSIYDYPVAFERPGNHKDHINYFTMYYPWSKTLKTKAKTCTEFIEEVDGVFKSNPVLLKKLREKAAEADRRYYSQGK